MAKYHFKIIMKALQICGHRENAVRARLKCRAHARSLEGTLHVTILLYGLCVSFIHSFIADIYIAPLEVGLLRGAHNPSTAEKCCFKLLKEFLGEYSWK